MTRVNINGSGHQVEVQHDGGELAYVIEKAQKLWEDTRPADRPGLPFGPSLIERNVPSDGYRYGLGRQSGPLPVRAETTNHQAIESPDRTGQ